MAKIVEGQHNYRRRRIQVEQYTVRTMRIIRRNQRGFPSVLTNSRAFLTLFIIPFEYLLGGNSQGVILNWNIEWNESGFQFNVPAV
jgi:hypothetical protein